MFGTVTEWHFRWLGGIRPVKDHSGFREFILAPSVPEGLDSLRCSYHSPWGPIVSNWTRTPEGIRYDLVIPEGCVARVNLAAREAGEIHMEKDGSLIDPGEIGDPAKGSYRMAEGRYRIW